MISLDSETTGIDLRHGARPFFISACDEHGDQSFWEWEVDPLTREPIIPSADKAEINDTIWLAKDYGGLVLQNGKFDVGALATIGLPLGPWPWESMEDTLISGHLLSSNTPHDLTTMALTYLRIDIKPFEDAVEKAVQEARRLCRTNGFLERHGKWLIAEKGLPCMPSAKEKLWRYDMWLPRAVAKAEEYAEDHKWWTVLQDYANADTAATLPLWQHHAELLHKRGLWEIYRERMKLLPVVYAMEGYGVTVSGQRLEQLKTEFAAESRRAGQVCINIAQGMGYDLELPKSGNNGSLTRFVFEELKLPPVGVSKKTGAATLDKNALDYYENTLPERSKPLMFIKSLRGKRKRDTAYGYMEGYARFWQPMGTNGHVLKTPLSCKCDKRLENCPVCDYGLGVCVTCGAGEIELEQPCLKLEWYRLHPSLNQTGTDTLRMSSNNPNAQNISKQEDFTLRYCFGPAPGREWWSLDYENIELRIPAYESGEQVMIELFEKPNEPPYFGSYHLMNASIIYPDLFWPLADKKGAFKEKYASTWYQWCKNFGFACAYGAVPESGTADRAAHKPGAQRLVMDKLKEHSKLNQRMIDHANRYGYVETLPDKTVSSKGYPVQCGRTKWGKISPTVPLNYHVQSTAMWCTAKAMVRCHEYLQKQKDCHLVLQVHDELVFDLPARGKENLPLVNNLRELMEESGDDIGIPLRVSMSYHPVTWSEKVEI